MPTSFLVVFLTPMKKSVTFYLIHTKLSNSFHLISYLGEILGKHEKIARISHLSIPSILEREFLIFKNIQFISEAQIEKKYWETAYQLVSDIDEKDTPYIAYSLRFQCKLWSGDKKLQKGLMDKGYSDIIHTQDLFNLREDLRK